MGVSNKEFLDKFLQLFAGRTDTYAVGTTVVNEKARYANVKAPLSREDIVAHLTGRQSVGIYPIVENKVKWALVDVDREKAADGTFLPNPWARSWEKAKTQKAAFERAGLHAYIERSRSGYGAHVWIFFSDWVPAHTARTLVKSLLTLEKVTPETVYPVQSSLASDEYGNLICLPFFGQSDFLDNDGNVIPRREFLATVETNPPEILPEIAPPASPAGKKPGLISVSQYRPGTPLVGALKLISPYGCSFMRHCYENRRNLPEPQWYVAIQQATCFRNGREFAHAISRDYPKYAAHEVDAKFGQALANPPAGCAYIREHFPELACANCPNKAPYEVANRSLKELVTTGSEPMEKVGDFKDDLALIRGYDNGTVQSGIDWGVPLISKHSKLRNSELNVFGGFPSLGKTAFMVANAINLAKRGVVVPLFSAETARVPLRQRLLSNLAEVDLSALRGERLSGKLTKQEWAALEKASTTLADLPIYTDFTSMSPDQVLSQIEDILLRDGRALDSQYALFFDYLQFGFREPGEENDTVRISRLAGEFKFVSKILEHPSVIFSQLRREEEVNDSEEESVPQLNWLASSSAIERTADVVYILTGARTSGLYALRNIDKLKDRDAQAPMRDRLLLQQNCGLWTDPNRGAVAAPLESLEDDFNR